MFKIATLLASIVAVLASRDLSTYTFDKYVQEFNVKVTPGSAEWQERKTIFLEALREIIAHNAGQHTYTMVRKF